MITDKHSEEQYYVCEHLCFTWVHGRIRDTPKVSERVSHSSDGSQHVSPKHQHIHKNEFISKIWSYHLCKYPIVINLFVGCTSCLLYRKQVLILSHQHANIGCTWPVLNITKQSLVSHIQDMYVNWDSKVRKILESMQSKKQHFMPQSMKTAQVWK